MLAWSKPIVFSALNCALYKWKKSVNSHLFLHKLYTRTTAINPCLPFPASAFIKTILVPFLFVKDPWKHIFLGVSAFEQLWKPCSSVSLGSLGLIQGKCIVCLEDPYPGHTCRVMRLESDRDNKVHKEKKWSPSLHLPSTSFIRWRVQGLAIIPSDESNVALGLLFSSVRLNEGLRAISLQTGFLTPTPTHLWLPDPSPPHPLAQSVVLCPLLCSWPIHYCTTFLSISPQTGKHSF